MGNVQAKVLQAQPQMLEKVGPKRCDEIGVTDITDTTQNPEAQCAVRTWLNKYAAHTWLEKSTARIWLQKWEHKKSYKIKVISLHD